MPLPSDLDAPAPRLTLAVVCEANICRSPHLAELVRRRLGPERAIDVLDAGTHARAGAPACAVMTDALDLAGPAMSAHRAAQFTTGLAERADLILAAGVHEKARAAEIAPAARNKTFTVIEAIRLAEAAEDTPEDTRALVPPDVAAQFVGRLQRQRLLSATSDDRLRARGGRGRTDSVVDPHRSGARHAKVAALLVALADDLVRVLP